MKRTLGQYPELMRKGIPETGTQLFGGGIVTAGGLYSLRHPGWKIPGDRQEKR